MRDIRVLSRQEVSRLIDALLTAQVTERDVRVTWGPGLMVKVGEGVWTAPLGKSQDELDMQSSASRQHWIDTGEYLPRGEA